MNQKNLQDLVLAQFAAESYLSNATAIPNYTADDALRDGNNNAGHPSFAEKPSSEYLGNTRMTSAQIARFNARYDVVHHQENTWTGFSGTLLKDKQTHEYVLSFRSTEFANQSKRDVFGSRDAISLANGPAGCRRLQEVGLMSRRARYH